MCELRSWLISSPERATSEQRLTPLMDGSYYHRIIKAEVTCLPPWADCSSANHFFGEGFFQTSILRCSPLLKTKEMEKILVCLESFYYYYYFLQEV